MNTTNYAIILNLTIVLTIASSCTNWIKREDFYTGNFLTCCSTSCKPGSFVSVCTTNGTEDKCVPCPEGTYMDDPTHSSLPQLCIPHECLPNSVPADSFPLKGCRKKCRCDVINGYTGIDPCDCQKNTEIEDVFSGSSSRKLYTTWIGGSTREVSRDFPLYTTDSTTLKNDNGLSNGDIMAICIGSAGVLLSILSLIVAVCCIKRYCRQHSEHTPLTTELSDSPPLPRPVVTVPPFTIRVQNGTALNGPLPLILGAETNNESTSLPHNQNGLTHPNGPPDNSYHEYLRSAPTIDPSSLGDDQIQSDSRLGEDQFQLDSRLGEDQIQLDSSLGENQIQLDSSLGEHQIQLDSSLGEHQIQFDSYPSAPLNDLNFTRIDYQLQTR